MEPVCFLWMMVLFLGLLLPVSVTQGGKFNVHGASGPVLSLINEDVILPCKIIPESKPENMEIIWAIGDKTIHTFMEGGNFEESHSNRTELFKVEFSHGNVSLKLKNVKVSDQDKYTCIVKTPTWYDDTLIELQVAGFGRTPVINVFSPYEDGIKLVCKSSAWYPEPKVLWTAKDEEDVQRRAETSLKIEDTGTFEVHSSVIVKSRPESALSCIIQNTLIRQEKVSRIMMSDKFYPRISTWMVLFIILVIIVLVTGAVAVWKYTEQSHKIKQAGNEMKKPQEAARLLNDELACDRVTAEADIVRKMKELELYKDELRITEYRCYRDDFILDKGKSHQDLRISSDGKSVWHHGNTQHPEEKCSFAFALGSVGYNRGNHSWEVDVSRSSEWVLGVTKKLNVHNKAISPMQSKGQWALKFSKNEGIYALEDEPTKLSVNEVCGNVGIYLSCEKGEISFIDVGTKKCVHMFCNVSRTELYPFFAPGSKDGDAGKLTICPIMIDDY